MATTAQYASTPKIGLQAISTANANRDGTGTLGTIFTAGTNGSRIERIVVTAQSTTTAGMIRLFLHNGTTAFLHTEIQVFANTPSGTNPAFNATLEAFSNPNLMPIIIPSGYSLRASTNNAETFNITAIGGDF